MTAWLRTLAVTAFAVSNIAATEADLRLVDAAKRADAAAVRALLKAGVNPRLAEKDGTTALHWAAYRDDLESVDALIRAGASVSAANDLGATPLWAAALNGNGGVARRLLAAGANPNAALTLGETLVMTAARSGAADVVEQLLASGADPNRRAARGQTALMWAIAQRHPGVVKALLAHGADVHARTDVWTAVKKTDSQQSSHPDYQVRVKEGGETALLFAARVGDVEAARLLVDAGANVNDQSASGTSATVLAAHSDHDDVVAFLLDRGADANTAGAGYTALHAAILRRNLKAVQALVEHGADANAPLRAPTTTRRDADDYYFHNTFVGATPIWLAARFSEPDVVRLLAQHGADPRFVQNIEYPSGSYGTYSRVVEGPTSVLMAALGMGGRRTRGWALPAKAQQEALVLDAVKAVLALGVDPNVVNADGNTALHWAADEGLEPAVKLLIESGASVEIKNKKGETALENAAPGQQSRPARRPRREQ